MAKRKSEADAGKAFWGDMQRMADEYDRDNPIVDTKYIVVEGYHRGNEYDYNIDWFETGRVEFDTAELRQEWLAEHDPDRNKEFRLARQDIRKFHPKPYTSRTPMTWERTND